MSDDRKKEMLEKTKKIYVKLPKSKDEVFTYAVRWDLLFTHNVLDKVAKPWIAKKMKQYLGVEEQAMIFMVLSILNQKCEP
mmetsp:Transcript_20390/g.14719  ORF Transcript_20390/g.14719 Transcript_20390/m.14719 type:complete len:81 (+) Transcript_20390:1085-1327(+)|eukprot:CAMPEP_0116871168 /NCGR_PEP_ID=MMETSP0463-20121206/1399_1 /TAXON_ID=181622 /ORGANISM="Strombidinopsis sp, Strain SopsisLIS2011" /LENGTH=80 /DNA_ID=CAMNT_0004509081 /DNA_START=1425 /DNA_END=1667 /DNA_ORIENTATION=+